MQANAKSNSRNNNEGPFRRQHQKLQKAIRMMEKKQKSKKAKKSAQPIHPTEIINLDSDDDFNSSDVMMVPITLDDPRKAKKSAKLIQPTEIINLDSDDEFNSSDVMIVPIPPPPTFTADDRAYENNKNNRPITLKHDNYDVQMVSSSSSFIKAQQIIVQSTDVIGANEKCLENYSRCNSHYSIHHTQKRKSAKNAALDFHLPYTEFVAVLRNNQKFFQTRASTPFGAVKISHSSISRPKPLGALPVDNDDGISSKFVAAETDEEMGDGYNPIQQRHLLVPKSVGDLIKFLREDITRLLCDLGNANNLLKCLQFLERNQAKFGYELAGKVRRSLNMILVGQAGLKDGFMHLDKLLKYLKTLMNDYSSDDVTPPHLHSEIIDHWKFIFTSYRHDNYQHLVDIYNKLIIKNHMTTLIIDPILLGQRVLDTTSSEE